MGTVYDEDSAEISIQFCGFSNQDIFGYFSIVDPKTTILSFLQENNYPIRSHKTQVVVTPFQKHLMPPPYSKCSREFPEFVRVNKTGGKSSLA